MISRPLLVFELHRATQSALSATGLFSTLLGAALLSWLVLNGIGPSGAAPTFQLLLVLGAAWASMAAVYAIDRNKNAIVEDVWFAFEPRGRSQLVSLYIAWLPIAIFQASLTGAVVLLLRPGSEPADMLGLYAGFLAALPLGLLTSALARLLPGFSLLAGVLFLAIIVCAQVISGLRPDFAGRDLGLMFVAYATLALVGFGLLTNATGRSR